MATDRGAAELRDIEAQWRAPGGCARKRAGTVSANNWALSIGAIAAVALTGLLAGCAHETATTTLRPNGSWTRKAVYTASLPDDPKNPQKQPALRDIFTPPAGAGWKVVKTVTAQKPAQIAITAEKDVRVGESVIGDLTVKAPVKKGAVPSRVANICTVTPAGPGRWRYTETFHWTGPRPDIRKDISPMLPNSIAKALPTGFRSDVDVRACTARVQNALWQSLFAPPEPLLLDFYDNVLPIPGLSDPDERQSMLTRRLGPSVEAALGDTFGARMASKQRHESALALTQMITDWTGQNAGSGQKMGGTAGKSPGADQASEMFAGVMPVAITLTVKMPGRVIETNGIVDPLAGDVYWTLYPQAALTHDITLRAVFEATPDRRASR